MAMNYQGYFNQIRRVNYLRKSPVVKKALDHSVSHAIGRKIDVKCENELLINSFNEIKDSLDYSGEIADHVGLWSRIYNELVLYGEVFILRRVLNGVLKVELFPSYKVPLTSEDLGNGRKVVDGIEFDKRNRKTAIYVMFNGRAKRVDFRNICHVVDAQLCDTPRGFTHLGKCIKQFDIMEEIESIELDKRRLLASMVLIRKEAGQPSINNKKKTAPVEGDPDASGFNILEVSGNCEAIFPPKDKGIEISHAQFKNNAIHDLCYALNVPATVITQDSQGIGGERGYRHQTLEQMRIMRSLVSRTLESQFFNKLWLWHCEMQGVEYSKPIIEFEKIDPIHPLQAAKAQKIWNQIESEEAEKNQQDKEKSNG